MYGFAIVPIYPPCSFSVDRRPLSLQSTTSFFLLPMASPVHLSLLKAEYAYSPQTDDEIPLEEDMLYYLLDDSDPE
jgi:hypothetical protein